VDRLIALVALRWRLEARAVSGSRGRMAALLLAVPALGFFSLASAFVAFSLTRFAERAQPPNLGALALRFGVANLATHLDRLRGRGISPVRPVTELTLEPYGRVRLAPIRSPDGVWLEFFEVLD